MKRYSSGMYVRSGVCGGGASGTGDPVVDEVLRSATRNSRRSASARWDVATAGRTVLFVSHNIEALRRTCEVGLVLSDGRVKATGSMNECINKYIGILDGPAAQHRLVFPPVAEEGYRIVDIEIYDERMQPIACPSTWQPVIFAIRFFAPKRTTGGSVTFQISKTDGSILTCSTTPDQDFKVDFEEGENIVYLAFDSLALSAGTYIIGAGLAIANVKWFCNEPHCAVMEVASRNVYNAQLSPGVARYPIPMPCRRARPRSLCPTRCGNRAVLSAVGRARGMLSALKRAGRRLLKVSGNQENTDRASSTDPQATAIMERFDKSARLAGGGRRRGVPFFGLLPQECGYFQRPGLSIFVCAVPDQQARRTFSSNSAPATVSI